jgi:hypothetical protein
VYLCGRWVHIVHFSKICYKINFFSLKDVFFFSKTWGKSYLFCPQSWRKRKPSFKIFYIFVWGQKESAATTEKTEIVQPSSDISTIEPPAIIVDVSNLEKPVTTNDVEIATKQEAPIKGIVIEEDVDKKKAKKKQSATKKKRFIGVTYHKKNGRWVTKKMFKKKQKKNTLHGQVVLSVLFKLF